MAIKARLDKAFGETKKFNHYVFGQLGDVISGGVYINKDLPMPDEITIFFKESKKEGEKE
jgi:hypothetical protein